MLRRRACLCALLAIVAAVPGDRPLRGSRQRDYSRRNLFGNIFGGGSAAVPPTAAIPATTDGFDPASNVCLLTIMTQERTASLHRMLGVWDGYVSIALLVDVYDEAAAEGINLLKYTASCRARRSGSRSQSSRTAGTARRITAFRTMSSVTSPSRAALPST